MNEYLVDDIKELIEKNPYIPSVIKIRYVESNLYQQSVVLFIYWLLKKKKNRLLSDWPLQKETLVPLANDIGVSTWGE